MSDMLDTKGKDFHWENLINSGAITRAAEYGKTDEMNTYLASFVYPEIAFKHPELRYEGTRLSIHATVMRMMEEKRASLKGLSIVGE